MNMLQILDIYSNLEFHMKINITMLGEIDYFFLRTLIPVSNNMEIKPNHKQGTANYTNQNQDRYPIPFGRKS